MRSKTKILLDLLAGQPVIPVIRLERAIDAVPLARALVAGGLRAIEITLRTDEALEAIRRVVSEVPEAVVGAGTVLEPQHFEAAVEAGSRFIVSPGLTQSLIDVAADSPVPFLPGAITPAEIMTARDANMNFLKFFPAEQAGGVSFIKALASPVADVVFCPTGGITQENVRNYLALPNVVCVGGSWVAPEACIKQGRWADIEALARQASLLRTV